MTYLDQAATTLQKPPQVAAAMCDAVKRLANPGRGGHAAAMHAAQAAFACRSLAGELFDIAPENVCFTLNATHALNIAIRTLVRQHARVVISGFEHNAVTRPLAALGAQIVASGGELFRPEASVQAFSRALTPDTDVCIVNHVSNVFGFVQPLEEIAALCRERRIPLIVDASQSAGTLPVSVSALGAAFVALPGHKGLYGPQGTGLLLCGQTPAPIIYGGTGSNSAEQEMPQFLPDRVEAGTLNVPGICGLAEGLRYVLAHKPQQIAQHEQVLNRQLRDELRKLRSVKVLDAPNAIGVLSFQVAGMDCEEVAQRLAEKDIAVRAGLHCAPLAHKTAQTLELGTVRASFSAFNTPQDVRCLLYELRRLTEQKEEA